MHLCQGGRRVIQSALALVSQSPVIYISATSTSAYARVPVPGAGPTPTPQPNTAHCPPLPLTTQAQAAPDETAPNRVQAAIRPATRPHLRYANTIPAGRLALASNFHAAPNHNVARRPPAASTPPTSSPRGPRGSARHQLAPLLLRLSHRT